MKASDSSVSADNPLHDVISRDERSASQLSRADQYKNLYSNWIYAPARILLNDPRGVVGLAVLALYVAMGTIGVMIVESPIGAEPGPLKFGAFMDWTYPLGTDHIGRSLLSLTVHSTPTMFIMIGAGAVFSTGMATLFGTVAGYKGGHVDQALMALTDVVLTIPGLPLIIVLSAIIEPSHPAAIGILLTITAWAGLARMLRSETLSLRQESYVEASRVMGTPTHAIILRDVLPNLMPYILINFTNSARRVIFSSVALYFLGVLPSGTLNWGVMLNTAFRHGALFEAHLVYWLVVPTVAVVGLTAGLILLSQSFDRVFNARARVRHIGSGDDSEE